MKPIQIQPPFWRALAFTATVAFVGLAQTQAQAQTAAPAAASAAMTPMSAGSSATSTGSEALHRSMMSGMEKMHEMKPTGDTDKDFAMMMKMHHQQALEMAKPELQYGKSLEIKALARKIVKDQTKEIAQFDDWLKKHR